MGEAIIMLPESLPLAAPLVEHVFEREKSRGAGGAKVKNEAGDGCAVDLLILRKQKETYRDIIRSYGFREVHVLDEEYYGGISKSASLAFLMKKSAHPYEKCYFPVNTFRANAFLFGSIIAGRALAVNASLCRGNGHIPETGFSLDKDDIREYGLPWEKEIKTIRETLRSVARTLKEMDGTLKVSGERPNLGILTGFGHDLEIFMKYAYGIREASGRKVLDIGGGLGYGSYLLSKFAEEVIFLDRSAETTDFVRRTWAPIAPNLQAICGEAGDLRGKEGYFDTVFLMDVIEHVVDPERLLMDVRSLLKPGGTLVLSTPEEDYYPYRVCPASRRGESEGSLLDDAIWPWHIQGLGERVMLPMLRGSGFDVIEKSYTTYVKGDELKRRLAVAMQDQDGAALARTAVDITKWDIGDFAITLRRDPCFSAASYNVLARKGAQCP